MTHKRAHWIMFILLLTCHRLALAAGDVHYVTDRIVLDLYVSDSRMSQVLRSVPTGTAMTILTTNGPFAKVKLNDGIIGWIDPNFLTDEKPIQVLYSELLGKYKALKSEAQEQSDNSTESDTGNIAALKRDAKNVGWLKSELQKTRDRAKTLETDLQAAAKDRDAAAAELATFKAQLTGTIIPTAALVNSDGEETNTNGTTVIAFQEDMVPVTWYNYGPIPLVWVGALTLGMLILGYFAGVVLLDRRIRKKHGGFRLY